MKVACDSVKRIAGLETLVFDEAGEQRARHDARVLSGRLPGGLEAAPVVLVYGQPATDLDLATLASLRRGPMRIAWLPASVVGRPAARLEALRGHLERHGDDRERRALILRSWAKGGLELPQVEDRAGAARLRQMLELADLLIFGCDEEMRRFGRQHSLHQVKLAVAPLAILEGEKKLLIDPDGPQVVQGEGARLLLEEAARGLGLRILGLDEFLDGPEQTIAALYLGADAALDPRALALAARPIPIIADIDTLLLDYLGTDMTILRFDDVQALRGELFQRRLDRDAEHIRPVAELRRLFDEERAARALAAAFRSLLSTT